MRITDAHGRTIGRIERDTNELPSGRPRLRDDVTVGVSRWRTVGLLALGATGALIVAGASSGETIDGPAPVTSAIPVHSASTVVESVAPFSGAPSGESFDNVVLRSSGAVTVNGYEVDNVHNPESPLRARYLETLHAYNAAQGTDSGAVSEGVRACGAIERGEAPALRERADALSDVPMYSTPDRRRAVVRAALTHLCPAYNGA